MRFERYVFFALLAFLLVGCQAMDDYRGRVTRRLQGVAVCSLLQITASSDAEPSLVQPPAPPLQVRRSKRAEPTATPRRSAKVARAEMVAPTKLMAAGDREDEQAHLTVAPGKRGISEIEFAGVPLPVAPRARPCTGATAASLAPPAAESHREGPAVPVVEWSAGPGGTCGFVDMWLCGQAAPLP